MDILALVKALIGALISIILAVGAFVTSLGGGTITVVAPPVKELPSSPGTFPQTSVGTQKEPSPVATSSGGHASAPSPTPVAPSQDPGLTTEALNALGRSALVNILCMTSNGGSFNPVSGSGVFIDTRGVILTNAHVAQYFLLHDYPYPGAIECTIRTGSPAQPRYTAELLYLPPPWIAANAEKLKTQNPTGTGESDYALLYVTGSVNPQNPLPQSFPSLPMSAGSPSTGDRAFIAAYPAGFLGGITITMNLYSTSANAIVGQLYSFSEGVVDLFSLGGTVVSQAGSSGGPVLNAQGKLEGIVVTEILADTTAGRDLRALSLGYIDRNLKATGKGGFSEFLSQDVVKAAAQFNADVAPAETKALVEAIEE